MKIVISSGHGKYIRGASGYIDEVDEARKVTNKVAELLGEAGVNVETFHDDVSHSQDENVNRIVGFHNSEEREHDVSVHFNCYNGTAEGCEVLYVSQEEKARKVCDAICASSGMTNRGPKKRTDLFFLNNTTEPAILIETCFVDSKADADIYHKYFGQICAAIATSLAGEAIHETPEPVPPDLRVLITIAPVSIHASIQGDYVRFTSDLDICNDGSGPAHGDDYHQPMTAYYSGGREGGKYLNADVDRYIVVPPQVRNKVMPVVMGCQGQVTNMETGIAFPGVVGEIGPDDKTGETAYCLAKKLNPSITYNSGDTKRIYLYELWPGTPATVDGFTYKLQPA